MFAGLSNGGIMNCFYNKNSYENMKDEELVELSVTGDKSATEFILNKYKNFVKAVVRVYFLVGADRDDVVQEGMIGLFKAIRDFDNTKQSSFKSFAEICVKRQVLTAIKNATRQKHIPLNSYISLSKPSFDDENSEETLIDTLTGDESVDPEQLFIGKENIESLGLKIEQNLSSLEKEVLGMYLNGISYQKIAVILGRSPKSIDNALQRVKKKIEKFI